MASFLRAVETFEFKVEKRGKAWLSSSQAPSGSFVIMTSEAMESCPCFVELDCGDDGAT
jgi:hypothetical protein